MGHDQGFSCLYLLIVPHFRYMNTNTITYHRSSKSIPNVIGIALEVVRKFFNNRSLFQKSPKHYPTIVQESPKQLEHISKVIDKLCCTRCQAMPQAELTVGAAGGCVFIAHEPSRWPHCDRQSRLAAGCQCMRDSVHHPVANFGSKFFRGCTFVALVLTVSSTHHVCRILPDS